MFCARAGGAAFSKHRSCGVSHAACLQTCAESPRYARFGWRECTEWAQSAGVHRAAGNVILLSGSGNHAGRADLNTRQEKVWASSDARRNAASLEKELRAWVRELGHGAFIHEALELRNSHKDGLGWFVREHSEIPSGALLIRIPPNARLQIEVACTQTQPQETFADGVNAMYASSSASSSSSRSDQHISKTQPVWYASLAQSFLHALSRRSNQGHHNWEPFLRSLPSLQALQDSLGVFTELALLNDAGYDPLIRAAREWRLIAQRFVAINGEMRRSTEEALWALLIVHTRAFRLADSVTTQNGALRRYALLPLIDLVNHCANRSSPSSPPSSSSVPTGANAALFSDGGFVDLRAARRALAAREQVLLSYGALANDALFCMFGFIEPFNPHDSFPLDAHDVQRRVQFTQQQCFSTRRAIAAANCSHLDALEVAAGDDLGFVRGRLNPRLVCFLRACFATERELDGIVNGSIDVSRPLSRRNEIAVLAEMKAHAEFCVERMDCALQMEPFNVSKRTHKQPQSHRIQTLRALLQEKRRILRSNILLATQLLNSAANNNNSHRTSLGSTPFQSSSHQPHPQTSPVVMPSIPSPVMSLAALLELHESVEKELSGGEAAVEAPIKYNNNITNAGIELSTAVEEGYIAGESQR